ncbi:MAG: glycosyltransferase [Deltaproteobacteria bacterium]|nr:glycosyltransferase [Deltaproteobacteria bacterium]
MIEKETAGIKMIDVVMVAYNRKEMVFEALRNMLDNPLIDLIVVVDNASSDNISREGPEFFPEAKWIVLTENEGCTAWNKGMAETRSDYVLILDDDCVPDIASLYDVAGKMEKSPSVGLAVFNIINQFTGKSEWGPLEKSKGEEIWANSIGACMLVRANAFSEVGGYKDYFLCFNDLDLVLSLWEAGYTVLYNERWKAFHKQKIIGTKKRRLFFEVRNLLWTIWGHLDIVPCLFISLKYIAGAFYDAEIREYGEVIKGAGKGLHLGLKQRSGRRGNIPGEVMQKFYLNFIAGARFPNSILKFWPNIHNPVRIIEFPDRFSK